MKRTSRGFTLTELLTVVAILAVLAAVALPGVIKLRNGLKMMELDECARQLFLAAQNTLTARRADGTLSAPQGETVQGQDGSWRWLFDDDTEFLLPDGAVDPTVAENHIAIWYNTESAMVLEVYYGERNGSFAAPGCDWNKNSIQNGDYSNGRVQSGDAADRRADKRIGYYDGTDLERGDTEQLLPPVLEIVNGDELTVKVTVPKAGEYWTNGVTLTVTMEELNGTGGLTGNSVEFSGAYSSVDGTYELVLDSLTQADKRFKEVCPGIAPGAEIRVTAELSAPPAANGTQYLPAKAWSQTNSLFEERSGDTVSVAHARHLQNLEDSFSGFVCENAITVNQTDSMDWLAAYPDYLSIDNPCITSYKGNGLEVRGLNGGMFHSTAGGMRLDGIRIVNPKINRTGTLGALANTANGATIHDCRVYISALRSNGTVDFESCKQYGVSGSNYVGGLIGSAVDCTITDSFAALYKVRGAAAGGLIGYAQNCIITNCYATAENLSGTGQSAMFAGNLSSTTVTGCYGAGNITSGGTVSGFANGRGVFSNSYCAVSYHKEDGTPAEISLSYGFADGGTGTCSYLTTKTPTEIDGAAGKSYEEMKTWSPVGWQALSAAQTHPYRAELDGKAYPFPGLKSSGGQTMPHYGSWPVQTVKGIKLYDSQFGTEEIHVVLIPRGSEITFWAEAEGGSVEVKMLGTPNASVINGSQITSAVDAESGRTKVTVAPKGNEKCGITYIELSAGGYTLRAVTVVYDANITLRPSGGTGMDQCVGTSPDKNGNRVVGSLVLNAANREGKLTAALAVEPSADQILKDFDKNIGKKTDGADLSIEKDVLVSEWSKGLMDGDPSVSFNGSGSVPVVETERNGLVLNVTGNASGTAVVIARWTMDEDIYAACEVKMKGARALIKGIEADGRSADAYPYMLAIEPEPGEPISLTLQPKLFNMPGDANGANSTYTWKLYKSGEEEALWSAEENWTQDGTFTHGLNDLDAEATYRVELLYEYEGAHGEQRSVDEVQLQVYRKAPREVTEYGQLKVLEVPYYLNEARNTDYTPGGEVYEVSVEQVTGSETLELDFTNKTDLAAYVDGAANARTKWYVNTNGWQEGAAKPAENWVAVSGSIGGVQVFLDGTERATVRWNAERDTLDVDGKTIPTGGSITVEGKDAGDFGDKAFVFELRADTAEAAEGEERMSSKTVTVQVMPKLSIDPQSKTAMGWWGVTDTEWNANRTDGKYKYIWTVRGAAVDHDFATLNVHTDAEEQGINIDLTYGPYTATATLTSKRVFEGLQTAINYDAVATVGGTDRECFLLEKNTGRTLELSWASTLLSRKIAEAPASNAYFQIDRIGSAISGTVGAQPYRVFGKELSRGPLALNWTLNGGWVNTSCTYYLYVVGLDIRDANLNGDIVDGITMDSVDQSRTLYADAYFPSELIKDGRQMITWSLDDKAEEIIELTGNGNSAVITAKRFSAVDYYATVTCAYTVECTNGRSYTYTKNIPVKVNPVGVMMLDVQPCTAADVPALERAFDDTGLDGKWLNQADGGKWLLVEEPVFGCNVMYLKVMARLGDMPVGDLNQYYRNIYSDDYYVEVRTAAVGDTIYIRVNAREDRANTVPTDLTLTVDVGTAEKKAETVCLYDAPKLVLEKDGAVVTNGSMSIPYQSAAERYGGFTARLEPALNNGDGVAWYLTAPAGYRVEDYLTLEGSTVRLLRDGEGKLRIPDFRAVLHAQSGKARDAGLTDVSSAGYALVFLPEDDAVSTGQTQRKSFDDLGA